MQDKKLSLTTKAALVFVAVGLITAGIWYFFEPDDFILVFYLVPVYCAMIAAGLFAVSLIRKFRGNASPYVIFGVVDLILGLCVVAFSIHNILTDTGWFAGLLGTLLLILVVPANVVLLVIDLVLWLRNKKKKKMQDCVEISLEEKP